MKFIFSKIKFVYLVSLSSSLVHFSAGNHQSSSQGDKDCWSFCSMLWTLTHHFVFFCSPVSKVSCSNMKFQNMFIPNISWQYFRTSGFEIFLNIKNGMASHTEQQICRYHTWDPFPFWFLNSACKHDIFYLCGSAWIFLSLEENCSASWSLFKYIWTYNC